MAVEVERGDLLDRTAPQLRVGGTLRDPEEELAGSALGFPLPLRPTASSAVPPRSSSARGTPAGGQMSKHIAMSEPRFRWIRAATSGENRSGEPS